jgi:16S rRNA (guanine966-N2)-methyltransferase
MAWEINCMVVRMRVISGTQRGRKLITPDGMDVRPTPDNVKEALFNIIQFNIEGRNFLDLFAGSGQIGIEAISRGAKKCFFVDESKESCDIIHENLEVTGFEDKSEVLNADSVLYIRNTREKFSLAFLDPPYRKGLLEATLPDVAKAMADGGIIICEHPEDEKLPDSAGNFVKNREYRYGKIMLTTYIQQN